MFRFFSRRRASKRPAARIGRFDRSAMQLESLEPRTMLAANSLGPDSQINVFTTEEQASPAVAMNANGDSVVVWQSVLDDNASDDNAGIFAQRFDFFGQPVGTNFKISDPSERDTISPSVAIDDAGNFVVAWNRVLLNDNGVPQESDLRARRFDSAGNSLGDEFTVNTGNETGRQGSRGNFVAMDSDGDFVITWLDLNAVPSALLAQRYDKSGAPLGPPISISPEVAGSFFVLQVAMDDDGNFAVAWAGQDNNPDDIERDIFSQFFAADGTELTTPFVVNTDDNEPASFDYDIARDAVGNTTIAWLAPGPEESNTFLIVGRQFDANGNALGDVLHAGRIVDHDRDGQRGTLFTAQAAALERGAS